MLLYSPVDWCVINKQIMHEIGIFDGKLVFRSTDRAMKEVQFYCGSKTANVSGNSLKSFSKVKCSVVILFCRSMNFGWRVTKSGVSESVRCRFSAPDWHFLYVGSTLCVYICLLF